MPTNEAGSPFTRAEARARGLTDTVLGGPRFHRLFTGVYVPAHVDATLDVRARAALRLAPEGALVARGTAAQLLGGVVPTDSLIHLWLPRGRMRVEGISATRNGRRRSATMLGIPVTTAEDTFLDLVPSLGLVDLVVLGDALVRAGRTTPGALVNAASERPGRHRRQAQRAASLVRLEVDSPMESRLRMLLVLAGLPEPVVNHQEFDDDGRLIRRYDLSFPEVRLAIEYDGRQHAHSSRQWERDVERREQLDVEGWRIVVVLSKGIYREPERTLARVVSALRERGVRAAVTSQEWQLHFPAGRPRAGR